MTGVLHLLGMMFVVVTVHELGHFIIAWRLGMPVAGVDVGVGPQFAGFSWRGMNFRWRSLPFGGQVRLCWQSKSAIKNIAVYGAGPAANIAFGASLLTVPNGQSLAVLSLVCGFLNLIPFKTAGVQSDGLKILLAVRKRRGKRVRT